MPLSAWANKSYQTTGMHIATAFGASSVIIFVQGSSNMSYILHYYLLPRMATIPTDHKGLSEHFNQLR